MKHTVLKIKQKHFVTAWVSWQENLPAHGADVAVEEADIDFLVVAGINLIGSLKDFDVGSLVYIDDGAKFGGGGNEMH